MVSEFSSDQMTSFSPPPLLIQEKALKVIRGSAGLSETHFDKKDPERRYVGIL